MIFKAMQKNSIARLECDGIVIVRHPAQALSAFPPIYSSELLPNSAPGDGFQNLTSPEPPPFPTTPEELEFALSNLRDDFVGL